MTAKPDTHESKARELVEAIGVAYSHWPHNRVALTVAAAALREARSAAFGECAAFVEAAKPPMTNNATAVVRRSLALIAEEFRERAAKEKP